MVVEAFRTDGAVVRYPYDAIGSGEVIDVQIGAGTMQAQLSPTTFFQQIAVHYTDAFGFARYETRLEAPSWELVSRRLR